MMQTDVGKHGIRRLRPRRPARTPSRAEAKVPDVTIWSI